MRWVLGALLVIGPLSLAALAQPKPPPLEPPAGRLDKFGEPLPQAAPPAGPAPSGPAIAAPPPIDALPAVARFRALLGDSITLAYRAAEPIDPATGSVRLLGARLTRGEGSLAIEELTLDGLGEQRIGAASARELVLTGPGTGTARIARLELREMAAPGLAPEALAVASLRLEQLTVEGDTPVSLAELVLEDYAAGRPGRLTLTGLDVLAPQAGAFDRVRTGRVQLRGLDLPGTIASLGAQETPPRADAGYALEIEDVVVTAGDRAIGGFGALRIQGDPTTAEGIETGRVALRELRLEPLPGLEAWLTRFGYPALLADLTAESRYDRARGRLELRSLSLAGREMGVLGLSLALDGVTPEAAEQQDWEQLKLVGLALRYLDQSLLGRAARDEARRRKTTEARVREGWASQLAAALGSPGGRGQAVPGGGGLGPVVAALQRFLRGEAKEVELTARPAQPVALGDLPAALLGGPAAAQRVLGLGAVAR
ncbi:hypothetical protein ACFQS7_06300 [Dankookia sp. GCM10030260]|uniref:hypothetical protein n=1 Tax=Dankookia sp. GCM10030260 TaxID=3273390 RepID=UPI003621E1B9